MTKPKLFDATDAHIIGTWKNVFFARVTGPTTVEVQSRLGQHLRQLVAQHPEGCVYMLVIAKNAPLPDGRVRDTIGKLLRSFTLEQLLGLSINVGGEGFWGGAARSVLTGIFLAARLEYPMKVFGTPSDATTWLATVGGQAGGWTGPELLAALDALDAEATAARSKDSAG